MRHGLTHREIFFSILRVEWKKAAEEEVGGSEDVGCGLWEEREKDHGRSRVMNDDEWKWVNSTGWVPRSIPESSSGRKKR